MRNYRKGDVIYVAGSGQRGNHGCFSEATVRLTADPVCLDEGRTWEIVGVVISATDCERCPDYWPEPGTVIGLRGWYDPEYYGHDGLQC